jgi:hypothetical protein
LQFCPLRGRPVLGTLPSSLENGDSGTTLGAKAALVQEGPLSAAVLATIDKYADELLRGTGFSHRF